MRKYRALAAVLVTVLPSWAMVACGDDGDDTPPSETGGSAGDGSGGKGGSATGGKGGSATGGKGGSGGTSGAGGEQPGGAGGIEETGGTTSTGGSGGSGGSSGGGCDLTGEGKPHETIRADITSDLTLTSDTVWDLDDIVKVHNGAVLTIEKCTRIEGSPSPAPGVLAVLRGGQIDAVGTADEPILFTSASAPRARSAGQWGGVVLLGNAPITASTTSKIFEGLTDTDFTYGGSDAEDSSGTMQYVRIEFGGWNILPDKEINGLSMGAVGSGTTLDHIMVSNTRDDCFEWWGGTVDASYLICNNAGDDMFDADEGYVAAGEYWFGRRVGAGAVSSADPSGFEWDGTESGVNLMPKPPTQVTATNATLCGTGVSGAFTNPEYGMVLRERATGSFDTVALLGFEYGIDTRTNTNTAADAIEASWLSMDNSAFWALTSTVAAPDSTNNDNGYVDDSFVTDGTNNDPELDPPPFTLEDCQAEEGPTDAVKDSDIGAFAGDATWMDGLWVDWSAN